MSESVTCACVVRVDDTVPWHNVARNQYRLPSVLYRKASRPRAFLCWKTIAGHCSHFFVIKKKLFFFLFSRLYGPYIIHVSIINLQTHGVTLYQGLQWIIVYKFIHTSQFAESPLTYREQLKQKRNIYIKYKNNLAVTTLNSNPNVHIIHLHEYSHG